MTYIFLFLTWGEKTTQGVENFEQVVDFAEFWFQAAIGKPVERLVNNLMVLSSL